MILEELSGYGLASKRFKDLIPLDVTFLKLDFIFNKKPLMPTLDLPIFRVHINSIGYSLSQVAHSLKCIISSYAFISRLSLNRHWRPDFIKHYTTSDVLPTLNENKVTRINCIN